MANAVNEKKTAVNQNIRKAIVTWLITLVISIGGGFIGAKVYTIYFNKSVKFYQFDLVRAIKRENAVLYGTKTTQAEANALFTGYLKKINKRLAAYSKKGGIIFIKGAVIGGNVPNITDKVITGK
jgi:hypothetical protein